MKYSKEEKVKLLESWKRSGKSISAYVKEQGLVRWTFTKWIKHDRETKDSLGNDPFVEVRIPAMQDGPEILIEKGAVKIHIPLCIEHEKLRSIFGTLGGAA